MNQGRRTGLNSRDAELLNRIEELRSRFLNDQNVYERISQRAYELYERRGGEPGRDVEDWIQAENEILSPLIEEAIHRAAKAAETQTGEGSGINVENAVAKKVRAQRALKPGAAKKRSAKSKQSDSKASKRMTKKKADGREKKRKTEIGEASRSVRATESNDEPGDGEEGSESS
jgi:DUF2934 family protein